MSWLLIVLLGSLFLLARSSRGQRWLLLRRHAKWRNKRLEGHGTQREELRAMLRGDLDDARSIVEEMGGPQAKLLLACIEVEAGRFATALEACEGSQAPEFLVLKKLIELRKTQPEARWLDSMDLAWLETGRPDLGEYKRLAADVEASENQEFELVSLSPADRAMCLWMEGVGKMRVAGSVPELLEWARTLEISTSALPELMVAVSELADKGWTEAMAKRFLELAPDNIWVQLGGFCARHGEGPLLLDELQELTHIAQASNHDLHICGDLVFERFVHAASVGGSWDPEGSALAGLFGASAALNGSVPLFARIEKTKGTALANGTTKVLAILGTRIMNESCHLISFLFGRAFLLASAKLKYNSEVQDALAKCAHESEAFKHITENILMNPGMWPIQSLQNEIVHAMRKDELGFWRKYIPSSS